MSVPPDSVVPPASTPEPPLYGLATPSSDERQWAMLAHLSALLGALVTGVLGGGWGCFIGPLVIWLIKRDALPFVNEQGKEALNFNITVAIAVAALWALSLLTLGIGLIVALPAWIVIGVAWLVLTIIAAVKANAGEHYRYPLCLRLIR